MQITRLPGPALSPFVVRLWASEETSVHAVREHVLPTGMMHLVFRLADHPLRVFGDAADATGRTIGLEVVGGARAAFYARDVSQPTCSVGVELRPGAAQALLGAPADALADAHTPLGDLWGAAAGRSRERLQATADPAARLDLLEALLAARLVADSCLHPSIAHALSRFAVGAGVRQVVAESGYSRRRFIALFRAAVGLTPKRYCRVLRFQSALDRAVALAPGSWIAPALDTGYSDQPHFNREFREFAGVSPGEYRIACPGWSRHVPVRFR